MYNQFALSNSLNEMTDFEAEEWSEICRLNDEHYAELDNDYIDAENELFI